MDNEPFLMKMCQISVKLNGFCMLFKLMLSICFVNITVMHIFYV